MAVYSCPFDAMTTETKGTVLLKTASELKEFSQGEENLINEVRGAELYEGGGRGAELYEGGVRGAELYEGG